MAILLENGNITAVRMREEVGPDDPGYELWFPFLIPEEEARARKILAEYRKTHGQADSQAE